MQRAYAGAEKGSCGNWEVTGETAARVWDPRPVSCFGSPQGALSLKALFLFYLHCAPLTPDRLASPQRQI